jgi:Zn finger protein HypA/HybF involved in hydrogenase expression
MEHVTNELERVRAMLGQALAEARTRGAERVTALHLTLYDRSPEALQQVREALAVVTPATPAQDAALVITLAPGRFICWNCCGLRYESSDEFGMCPNCGGEGIQVPPDITFALDHIEVQTLSHTTAI